MAQQVLRAQIAVGSRQRRRKGLSETKLGDIGKGSLLVGWQPSSPNEFVLIVTRSCRMTSHLVGE